MGSRLSYFLFLLWLTYLIVSSIHLFTKGFLLTRTVQRNNSTCISHNEIPCTSINSVTSQQECSLHHKIASVLKKYSSASDICLPPRTRVILLIVDALRYDFTVYNETNIDPLPFQNKLPVVHESLRKYPDNSRLYKFIADPPTTTMQRLKALTTGSLPTFIDAGSNFATSEINEDNIIDQLIKNNHHIVFMGDDTWSGLFPNRFTRNFPYPSFNVWDLDTVDNGVKVNLYPELNNTDWSLLIGHFLGVDHCGHRYGPNHPEMSRKLTEINSVLENVIKEIDEHEDMMLFVIGDHGMTVSGDHGGESEDEVTAAMFVYSKHPLSKVGEENGSVKQVDLVPTLSILLGIPIPFQNLGVIIQNCLPLSTIITENWHMILYSMWGNVQQVMNYIKEYSENEHTFDGETLDALSKKHSVLSGKIISIDSEDKFEDFSKELVTFLTDIRDSCERIWIQFDSFSMARGLLFLFLTIFLVFIITDGIPIQRHKEIFSSSYIVCSYSTVFSAAGLGIILYLCGFVDDVALIIYFLTCAASQMMLALIVIQNWETITLNWYSKSKTDKYANLVCRLVLIFNLCGLFSNSYIIEESFVLLFLLSTVIIIGSIGISSSTSEVKKKNQGVLRLFSWLRFKFLLFALMIAGFVRGSMYFWRCREEQQWCFASYHEVSNIISKIETTKLQWTITVICLGIFVFATKEWLKNAGNLNGYSVTVTLAKFMPTAIVVCMAGYWALIRVPSYKKQPFSSRSPIILAWVVYGSTALGIISCLLQPLCTYIISSTGTVQNTIPALFKKLKSNKTKDEDAPVVCGLGTVYSSVFIIIGVYVTLLFALLLGDGVAPSAVIMFMTAIFVVIISSILRIEKVNSVDFRHIYPVTRQMDLW
ncbi:unnamed protein product [Phaedon cochleariae]|uniref:GPI ethanolamine phosphate transferase 3, catalytic subunit n=1 Tax=Phaedon cochleariae TaxID=80249 RepID=A0A9P0DKU6_PHACE|nr:unnamed protein product [Phaedon cochleariae]